MNKEDCFELGKIDKPKGLNGVMTLSIDSDDPTYYSGLDSILIELKNQLIPHFIERLKIDSRGKGEITLEDVKSIEEAEEFRMAKLYLPLDMLPKRDDEDFYYHEIVSYTVEDEQQGELGTVTTVYSMSANDLIAMDYQDKEVLIPINLVVKADHTNKKVLVDLPEGLLELYLTE